MIKKIPFVSASDFEPKLVSTFRDGYSGQMLARDLFSGLTMSVIALPLAIAFSIAAGASPYQGLWTLIITGFVVAAIGGSKYMVTGPELLCTYSGKHCHHIWNAGLFAATIMAGLILVIMGLSGLGKLIKFIPYPVTTGLTTGIAFIIALSQVKDFLGIRPASWPGDFFERAGAIISSIHTISIPTVAAGLATLVIILIVRRFAPRIPSAVIAVTIVTLAVYIFRLPVDTIQSRFGGIPAGLPSFSVPAFSWVMVREIFPSAFTIALLVSIETLMAAVVADGMTGDRHNPNMELLAQGVGNLLAGFLEAYLYRCFGTQCCEYQKRRCLACVRNGACPHSPCIYTVSVGYRITDSDGNSGRCASCCSPT